MYTIRVIDGAIYKSVLHGRDSPIEMCFDFLYPYHNTIMSPLHFDNKSDDFLQDCFKRYEETSEEIGISEQDRIKRYAELVMEQCSTTFDEAIELLEKHDNDIVAAVFDYKMQHY